MAKRFFICKESGDIIGLIHDGGGKLSCCGEDLKELKAIKQKEEVRKGWK